MMARFSVLCWLFLWSATNAIAQIPSVGDSIGDPLPKGAVLRMGSSRLAHGTWLTCVRFSADDRWVGAADSDGFIRVWEVATGRLLWEMPKSSGRKLAFSPDGETLAIGGYYNRTITLWDLKKRSVQLGKSGTRSPSYTSATAMAFSQDGIRAAVVEYDGGSRVLVGIYELDGGVRVASLDPFGGKSSSDAWVSSMAFSPDGGLLAIGALSSPFGDARAPSSSEASDALQRLQKRLLAPKAKLP